MRVSSTTVVSMGMEKGERKQGERDGVGGVCARASVATGIAQLALTNVSVWSLPASTSDRHAFRHVADCHFSAGGNLHRDLDLAAGRPAVLAHP
eukprot:1979146-Pleurochrysis_carterae.AAC.1